MRIVKPDMWWCTKLYYRIFKFCLPLWTAGYHFYPSCWMQNHFSIYKLSLNRVLLVLAVPPLLHMQSILRHLFILVRQTTNKPKYFPKNKLMPVLSGTNEASLPAAFCPLSPIPSASLPPEGFLSLLIFHGTIPLFFLPCSSARSCFPLCCKPSSGSCCPVTSSSISAWPWVPGLLGQPSYSLR